MTAPESSPLGSAKPAEAIALEAVDTILRLYYQDKSHTEMMAAFLEAAEQIAAIQRGDGQTRPSALSEFNAVAQVLEGDSISVIPPAGEPCAKPAAKPAETSGATLSEAGKLKLELDELTWKHNALREEALAYKRVFDACFHMVKSDIGNHDTWATEIISELNAVRSVETSGATPAVSTAIRALKAIQIDGGEDESGSEEQCVGWPSRDLIKAALRDLNAVRKSAGAEAKRPSGDIFGNERMGRPNQADAVLAQLTAERTAGAVAKSTPGVAEFAAAELNIFQAELRYCWDKKVVLPPSYFEPLKARLMEYDKLRAKSTPGVDALIASWEKEAGDAASICAYGKANAYKECANQLRAKQDGAGKAGV